MTTTMAQMKAGVIGLGFMGAAHVDAITSYQGAELAAVVTTNTRARDGDLTGTGGNLELGTRQFDFSKVRKYSAWHDLIADPAIEAVSICLPTYLHSEVAIAALNAGKHVLCEKPMALNISDCDRMLEAAAKSRRILMIGQVLRFWPAYRALREFVTTGHHGNVRQATFVRKCGLPSWSNWLPDESRSGGAILDLLIHDIDQILLLFGTPERVTAKPLGNIDALMASFIYPNGPEVRLQGGWFAPGMPFSMSFQIRADRGEMELAPDGIYLSDMAGVRKKLEVESTDAYTAEVHYFLDCCQALSQPSLCPPTDSAFAVRVALALKESRAKDGQQIKCLV
jgi:predicted dehydrogenase